MRRAILAGIILAVATPLLAMSQAPTQRPDRGEDETMRQDGSDTCNASAFQDLIGQPRAAVEALEINGPVRIIGRGERVTMDYRPERINFDLDENDRVIRVRCG